MANYNNSNMEKAEDVFVIKQPTHRETPILGLLAISIARLYPSKLPNIQRGIAPKA